MQYTRQVQYLHSQLAPAVPIDSFIDAIKPAALGLTDKSQFYAPVRFAVQICGGINAPAGAIRVDVPIHANERWLDDMKKRFAGMIGLKNSLQGSDISFRTVAGKDISTIDQQHLPRVGKLNVYVGDKKIRLPAMPAIPVEYSVCKEANIQAWLQKVSTELPDLIARELVAQKNLTQLDAAVRGDGPVLKLIQKHLLSSAAPSGGGGWGEFLRTHHMNSPDRIGSSEAQATLVSVSKDMLSNLRRFIEASAEPIGSYISHLDAKRIASDLSKRSEQDVDHYKPLLASAVPGGAGNGNIDGHELYRKITEDALASPFVQQAIIATVYTRPIEAGCRWKVEPGKDGKETIVQKGGKKAVAPAQPKVVPVVAESDEEEEVVAPASETVPTAKVAPKPSPLFEVPSVAPAPTTTAPSAASQGNSDLLNALPDVEKNQVKIIINRFIAAANDDNEVEQLQKEILDDPNSVFKGVGTKNRFNAFVSFFGGYILTSIQPKTVETWFKNNRNIYKNIVSIAASIGAHHPWNAQIHHTLQPLADGVYPTYYNLLHTKQDMSKDAAFAGDVVETYKAYHMFSGLPISPPGLVVEPIAKRAAAASGGGRRSKKKSGKWSDSSDDDNKFHRMKSEIPPLIPLGDHADLEPIQCGSCGGGHSSSSDDEPQDEKMMSMIRGNMPPLERIDCGMSSDEDDENEKKKKKNVMQSKSKIGSSIAPPVVPLNGIPPRPPLVRVSDVQAKIRSRLVSISDDMQDIESSDSMANEDIGDAYGLPSCSDVFGD